MILLQKLSQALGEARVSNQAGGIEANIKREELQGLLGSMRMGLQGTKTICSLEILVY